MPQHRERILIAGFDTERYGSDINFEFNVHPDYSASCNEDNLGKRSTEVNITLSDKLWLYLQNYALKHKAAGNGFGYGIAQLNGISRTLSARYYKDGSEILIEQPGKKSSSSDAA